jgi:HEAT repeat protein
VLIEALQDPDRYVRGSAASALGAIGEQRARPFLEPLLDDSTPVSSIYGTSIAEVAQHALGQLGGPL